MKRLNKQGFSMIELLVVLLIIGILAAVAAPLFLANSTKAEISEAVAGAGEIRSGERSYIAANSTGYLAIASGSGEIYFGTEATSTQANLLGVQIHGNKYFSPNAYEVDVPGVWSATIAGVSASPVDFMIKVTGTNSVSLTTDSVDGAASPTVVSGFIVEMDNAGQTIYTTNSGTTWSKF